MGSPFRPTSAGSVRPKLTDKMSLETPPRGGEVRPNRSDKTQEYTTRPERRGVPKKGYKQTLQHRAARSTALKGRKQSPEHVANAAAARKAAREARETPQDET